MKVAIIGIEALKNDLERSALVIDISNKYVRYMH